MASRPVGQSPWSLDARVLVHPRARFRELAAARPRETGWARLVRRPLFLAFVLGCIVSLAATGTLTARLVFPVAVYWAFVPAAEILSLAAAFGRRAPVPFSSAVDAYFTGHAAWMVTLLAVMTALASAPPSAWWLLLTTVGLGAVAVAIVWSVWTDLCFFREVIGFDRVAAIRAVAITRAIAWPLIFGIFAVPDLTPWGLSTTLVEAVREILR